LVIVPLRVVTVSILVDDVGLVAELSMELDGCASPPPSLHAAAASEVASATVRIEVVERR
jgi:hypothetical protein